MKSDNAVYSVNVGENVEGSDRERATEEEMVVHLDKENFFSFAASQIRDSFPACRFLRFFVLKSCEN